MREAGLNSCLYTGLEQDELERASIAIIPQLTYLKTGRWKMELGGLDSPHTNQRFIDLRSGEVLNHLFVKDTLASRPKIIPLVHAPQPAAEGTRSAEGTRFQPA